MFADAHIYLGVAFAGLLSFLSPCVLPLVPPYLVYLGGTSMEQMTDERGLPREAWLRVVGASIFFVMGFTTVFVLLGAGASAAGQLLSQYKTELGVAAGVVIILFGLHFLGLLRVPMLYREARFHGQTEGASYAGAYLLGLAFAFGWTPCVGPILSVVLSLASQEESLSAGVRLLFVYSLGLGVPFVLAALAIRPFLAFMQRFRRHLGRVEKGMGVLMVLTGLLFITGSIGQVGNWLIETFPSLATIEGAASSDELRRDIKQMGTR
jgi:cytochrome c-type biogenesis protein